MVVNVRSAETGIVARAGAAPTPSIRVANKTQRSVPPGRVTADSTSSLTRSHNNASGLNQADVWALPAAGRDKCPGGPSRHSWRRRPARQQADAAAKQLDGQERAGQRRVGRAGKHRRQLSAANSGAGSGNSAASALPAWRRWQTAGDFAAPEATSQRPHRGRPLCPAPRPAPTDPQTRRRLFTPSPGNRSPPSAHTVTANSAPPAAGAAADS